MLWDHKKNIVLIGMPGAGKSTLGVLLAKTVSFPFLDTDIYIQTQEGQSLQSIIQEKGMENFLMLEESHILSLKCTGHVIATGGSAVYSRKGMEHLKKQGLVLLLELSLPLLIKRIEDMDARGVVREPGQGLESLYLERKPLYEQYADRCISCNHKKHEQIIREILSCLRQSP